MLGTEALLYLSLIAFVITYFCRQFKFIFVFTLFFLLVASSGEVWPLTIADRRGLTQQLAQSLQTTPARSISYNLGEFFF